jgi:hypothetical protein
MDRGCRGRTALRVLRARPAVVIEREFDISTHPMIGSPWYGGSSAWRMSSGCCTAASRSSAWLRKVDGSSCATTSAPAECPRCFRSTRGTARPWRGRPHDGHPLLCESVAWRGVVAGDPLCASIGSASCDRFADPRPRVCLDEPPHGPTWVASGLVWVSWRRSLIQCGPGPCVGASPGGASHTRGIACRHGAITPW